MTGPARLIHVGNAIADLVLEIDALPERGGDVLASSSRILAGGAVNTLVAAVRDGLPAVYAGALGTGPVADVVRAALDGHGIPCLGPTVPGVDTGYAIGLVDAGAERTFVTVPGAEGRLTRAALDGVEVRWGDVVAVSGYSLGHPANALALPGWVASLAEGVTVIVDPSPLVASLPSGTLAAILARADVVTANAREARLMTGQESPARASEALAATAIAARRSTVVVVRDGPRGCWVVDASRGSASGGRRAVHVRGFDVVAVDTTGAGDAHLGVLAAALSRGDDPIAAARRANAAAALAVTRLGPAESPRSDEIDALLGR
ncbi:Ribokinase [Frondihabitans sp. 762G35]|uniref:PfkB family carbohydrate kinase n=1 Tax=Frondihabitans sp. 762G35 TaxID=1446794 RepID=UPI000D1FE0ED|nr:PfkB family carbohydrate kinase [Frondihabitans sp. 762G35]ARC57711.1 Ribokinase [Frondihabitans sp. 762G35]